MRVFTSSACLVCPDFITLAGTFVAFGNAEFGSTLKIYFKADKNSGYTMLRPTCVSARVNDGQTFSEARILSHSEMKHALYTLPVSYDAMSVRLTLQLRRLNAP